MIRRLYELVTGRPWTTCRSATAEFGPPPADDPRFAEALRHFTDDELLSRGPAILADLREQQAAVDRLLELARELAGRPEEVVGSWR